MTQSCAAVVQYGFAEQLDAPFGTLEAGTGFRGESSYEPSQPDVIPLTPRGDYNLLNFSLTIGGSTLSGSGPGSIRMWDNTTPGSTMDQMMLGITSFIGFAGGIQLGRNFGISISLTDEGSLWSGVLLPGPGLTLADFNSGARLQLTEDGVGPGIRSATGALTILVPEPSGARWLCLGLGWRRRRGRRTEDGGDHLD